MVVVILASASPRRLELLARLCDDFRVAPADIDERLDAGALDAACAALALRKARAVAAALRPAAGGERTVVLGADTVVVIDDAVLGKPADAAEAGRMLRRLRGRRHQVITGVGVVDVASGRAESSAVVTQVLMDRYTEEAIERYVETGEPLDKAGAYAVQGAGGALVAGIVGSYTNVVGLPLAETRRLLAGFGVPLRPAAEP